MKSDEILLSRLKFVMERIKGLAECIGCLRGKYKHEVNSSKTTTYTFFNCRNSALYSRLTFDSKRLTSCQQPSWKPSGG